MLVFSIAWTCEAAQFLNVSLYPFLPRPDQFKVALQEAWNQRHPDVSLVFYDYDCYKGEPSDILDVFVFDAIYLSEFRDMGFLYELSEQDIDDWESFMDFTWDACKTDGVPYAIPYLGCINVLFYREGDEELGQVVDLSQLHNILGDSSTPDVAQPPPGKGLLIDLTGGTTDACLYLLAQMAVYDEFTMDPPLLPSDDLDPQALANLQLLTKMAGVAQASYVDVAGNRVSWFVAGDGRALVGPTETLCSLPPDRVDSVRFRPLPLAKEPRNEYAYYVDAIGIKRNMDPRKRPLAIELANLMASNEVLLNSIRPLGSGTNAQYLIPARRDIIPELIELAPMYEQIVDVLLSSVRFPFRIGPDSRTWISENKASIRNQILYGESGVWPPHAERPPLGETGNRLYASQHEE